MKLFKRPSDPMRIREMGETLGLDLMAEQAKGKIAAYKIRAAETHCGECRGRVTCTGWLLSHSSGADHPPEFCPNRALYAKLKA